MKSGFYLSPCGKHITQVAKAKSGHIYTIRLGLLKQNQRIVLHSCYKANTIKAVNIILSGWEFLN
jgi:hypothetical protein